MRIIEIHLRIKKKKIKQMFCVPENVLRTEYAPDLLSSTNILIRNEMHDLFFQNGNAQQEEEIVLRFWYFRWHIFIWNLGNGTYRIKVVSFKLT